MDKNWNFQTLLEGKQIVTHLLGKEFGSFSEAGHMHIPWPRKSSCYVNIQQKCIYTNTKSYVRSPKTENLNGMECREMGGVRGVSVFMKGTG